jgi:hypothetical protein
MVWMAAGAGRVAGVVDGGGCWPRGWRRVLAAWLAWWMVSVLARGR